MKHTPGPWGIYEDHETDEILIEYKDGIIVDRVGKLLSNDTHDSKHNYLVSRVSNELLYANARLIAAAPDLLEACKYAFENLKPKGNIKKDFSGHNAMATLSRAIAKATKED